MKEISYFEESIYECFLEIEHYIPDEFKFKSNDIAIKDDNVNSLIKIGNQYIPKEFDTAAQVKMSPVKRNLNGPFTITRTVKLDSPPGKLQLDGISSDDNDVKISPSNGKPKLAPTSSPTPSGGSSNSGGTNIPTNPQDLCIGLGIILTAAGAWYLWKKWKQKNGKINNNDIKMAKKIDQISKKKNMK